MKRSSSKAFVKRILDDVDIEVDGPDPWDIHVLDERFYSAVVGGGSLAFGETFVQRWWDTEELDTLIYRLLRADVPSHIKLDRTTLGLYLASRIPFFQGRRRDRAVAEQHYDLHSDLFLNFLDPHNQYTCGYFRGTDELDTAQENKLDLICRKLHLQSTDHVLDIGCGWGGFRVSPPNDTFAELPEFPTRLSRPTMRDIIVKVCQLKLCAWIIAICQVPTTRF